MQLTPLHREMLPHWSDANGCWCSHDHAVYRYSYDTGTLRKVFSLPPKPGSVAKRLKDRLARSWFRRRFWPGPGLGSLVALANGDVVVIFDRTYVYSSTRHGAYAEVLIDTDSTLAASPLRGSVAVHTPSQHIYYGEYLNGHDCDIRINADERKIEACWSFVRSDIKHIHAICHPPAAHKRHTSGSPVKQPQFTTVNRYAGNQRFYALRTGSTHEH